MAKYTKEKRELLRRNICSDCQKMALRLEGSVHYCEGARGNGTGGCLFFISDKRLKKEIRS